MTTSAQRAVAVKIYENTFDKWVYHGGHQSHKLCFFIDIFMLISKNVLLRLCCRVMLL